jgi:integrase
MPILAKAEKHLVVPARIIRFLLATALRGSECRNCRFEQIDEVNRKMVIPASHAKSKRVDSIPLNAAALQVLAECDRSTPFPFANPATGLPYVSFKKSFITLMQQAGITDLTAHDLRRTAASLAISSGRTLAEVRQLLRNSSYEVTLKHYAHLSTRSLEDASDTISDQLLRAASGDK